MTSENPSTGNNPSTIPPLDSEQHGIRAVAFPEDSNIREEKLGAATRPKGVEMKRTLTQEEKDLAAAGYDHLQHPNEAKEEKLTNVDIHEHQLSFDALGDELKTDFNLKDPGHSFGLTADEAKARLLRDGPNILTPPKKKSAFMKVRSSSTQYAYLMFKNILSFWNVFSLYLTSSS